MTLHCPHVLSLLWLSEYIDISAWEENFDILLRFECYI